MSLRTVQINSIAGLLASSFFISSTLYIIISGFKYYRMEMKINFDQLFNSTQELNSTFQTPSSQIDRSYQTSLNHSFQYKLTFNQTFFDQQAEESDLIKLVEDNQQAEEVKSVHTKKSTKTKQSATSVRPSQPGQRLYYQSQESEVRKNKERERLQKEKVAELKSMPFAPTINKKSRKLAQKIKTEPKQQIRSKPQAKTTVELKEQQLMKECTFQPKLIAKNAKGQIRTQQELFYYLHNTSKIKEMRLNQKVQQQLCSSKMKKVSKQVFIEFLKRNEEYNNVIKKKHQIMKQKAENYDLKTGEKLYSPKILDNKFQNSFQKHLSSKNILISPKNAEHHYNNNFKSLAKNKQIQPQLQKPKLKSNIFAKKNRNGNYQTGQTRQLQKPLKTQQKQEEYYSQQYRQYSEQFDRRTATIHESSLSHHQVIPEESQTSFHQIQKEEHQEGDHSQYDEQRSQIAAILNNKGKFQKEKAMCLNEKEKFLYQGGKFLEEEPVYSEAQVWNSHQIRPFELSNVNQYLNASEQDEHQPRNNYVMDILNNLMSSKAEQE